MVNNTTGTITYNTLHHKLLALVMVGVGLFMGDIWWMGIGALFYAHSSFDRMLVYGLKYLGSPGKTHLCYIGKEKYKNKLVAG